MAVLGGGLCHSAWKVGSIEHLDLGHATRPGPLLPGVRKSREAGRRGDQRPPVRGGFERPAGRADVLATGVTPDHRGTEDLELLAELRELIGIRWLVAAGGVGDLDEVELDRDAGEGIA